MALGRPRALLGLLVAPLAACSGSAPAPAPVPAPGPVASPGSPPVSADPVADRVVVLHVPGVDPDLVERWRADLPALDRLSPGRRLPRVGFDPPGVWTVVGDQAATGRRGGAAGPLGGSQLDRSTGQLLPARVISQSRTTPTPAEAQGRPGGANPSPAPA